MYNVLLLFLCVATLSSCGILLWKCRKTLTSAERRMRLLQEITRIASTSVELRYPGEPMLSKKKQACTLTYAMLREMHKPAKEHLVIDCLLDTHVQNMDTDARMMAIQGHMADRPTQRDIPAVRLQNTPSLGMRQVARQRTGGLST